MDRFIQERICNAMQAHALDALVAFSKENVAYGAGYIVPSQALGMRHRQFAVAINRRGESRMLLTSNELEEAQARATLKDLVPYDYFVEDPMQVLVRILSDLGIANGRIGLEMDALSASHWETLKSILPNGSFVPATAVFQEARKVKTPREKDLLRKAARIADRAQLEAHRQIRVGMTEQELYRLLVDRALANEAENILMIQVAAAERSSFSNPTPSDRAIAWGDMVKIDVFVSTSGYLSDTGRGVVVGEATVHQKKVWSRMQETLTRIEDMIRPGVRTSALWNAFIENFGRYEMKPAIRFLGHGLGLSLHEEPYIAAHADTVIEEGMVFAIEPVYQEGSIGYHIEDNVLVTRDGIENLTTELPRQLIVVG